MNALKKKTKGTPSSVDEYVGQRLRVRRSLLGLSQEKLAEAIGLTFQQVQKYERGLNRISAGRLFQLSEILDVPVSYFFDHMVGGTKTTAQNFALSDNDQAEFMPANLLQSKETLDLVRAYYSITDPEMRKTIYRFVKSMAEKMTDEAAGKK